MSRRVRLAALAIGLVVTLVLCIGHHGVGYVRDEGVYFAAGRSYATWVTKLASEPARALRAPVRDQHFRANKEHPALIKTLAGVSARILSRPSPGHGGGLIPLLREGAAMRVPAQLIAGLGVSLLFIAGHAIGGIMAGVMAAGWFILLPRVWFNAGLCAFDVPVAVAIFAVVLAYRRALDSRGWGIALGPILGVAIAVKHNALFVPLLLGAHYLSCLAWARLRQRRRVTWQQLVPLPMVSMVLLAPLTAIALWPWLWSDTITRIGEYFAFHRFHSYYNMEFLGTNYHEPMAMPISYPVVMTWATVPTVLVVLALIGIGLALRDDLRPDTGKRVANPRWDRPLPKGWPPLDGVLLALMASFPIVLIALPSTPIFGGTKHFVTAYPFLALGAAQAWTHLWKAAAPAKGARRARPFALALCLGPGAIATMTGHPYNLSQYAPLVGGARGAADLGLNRGFWGHAVLPLVDELARTRPRGGGLYVHDLHTLVQRQYAREGRWPPNHDPAPIGRARAGLLFHEKHMATYEIQLWNELGVRQPSSIVTLHDVPLTSLYVAGAR